ncbi:MAG: helix-turn-helix domain-containing protein [Methanomassiliicoccaceae archaeon]|nr:helix-turn-helix domain-containing protein [Methanomassiliicoccaceae archaeon]
MSNKGAIKDIDLILAEGEGYRTEFKGSPNKDLASEACAFANSSGGRIFIGIDDKGRVVGTDTGNAARSRIQDTINNIEPRPDTTLEVYDDIIVVTVQEGKDKPYMCSDGFYLRMGPNSQKLDRKGICDFLKEEGVIMYDSLVRNKFKVKDNFDEKAYKKYIEKAGISDTLSQEHVLRHLHCAELNMEGELVYTNVGALFFRDNEDDVFFRYAQIVCVLFKGLDKFKVIDSARFCGGMLDNIDRSMEFLWRNLRARHEIRGVRREEILEIPEGALREAVVNAACHRDYFEEGANVMVEIYDDRVVVHNPGGLPKGLTLDKLGEKSVTRNNLIAEMLFRAEYIEKMGTGIKKIRGLMEGAGLEAPTFESTGFFTVTFKRPLMHTLTIERVQGDTFPKPPVNLSENEVKICNIISKNNNVTAEELSLLLGKSESTVRRILKQLTEKGIIERTGSRKDGSWKLL